MDVLSPDRLFTIAAFLAVLLGVWLYVRLNRTPIAQRLKQRRRLEVAEVQSLGSNARAVLLIVDGARLLIVTGPRSGTAIHALDDAKAPALCEDGLAEQAQ
ncbi:MAG: flagellar biosynthetic protein FliO [Pseudomonadota bacterium]